MTRRRGLAAGLALLISAMVPGRSQAGSAEASSPAEASLSPERLAPIGDFMRNEIAAGKIPGAIVLIQQHGHPVYFKSFGVRDVESRHPMTADTIFRIYSMSKPITSVAAMMLVEDGKLALADPVSKYIPAFADVKVGVEKTDDDGKQVLALEPLKRPISIEDLMRHTSGLTYGFYGDDPIRRLYAESDMFDGDFDNAAFVARLGQVQAVHGHHSAELLGHAADRDGVVHGSSRSPVVG
ncbi:serine hydrolase domain-containing protein, partial [Bradyrhizobium sp.]|uniref:serine hydrolase domain-containing protein n=1 Tax=Bradyrhizobium sp. TaxID=376 RepID=UPI003C6F2F5D